MPARGDAGRGVFYRETPRAHVLPLQVDLRQRLVLRTDPVNIAVRGSALKR